MNWYNQTIILDDKKYSLIHLSPFSFQVDLEKEKSSHAISFNLIIKFSSHCVSEEIVKHDSVLFPDEGGKNRYFSIERYQLSLSLPEILKNISERQCYCATRRNYLTVEILDANNNQKRYHIYFSVKKTSGGVELLVESAYIPNNPERQTKKIKGKVILANIHRGKKIAHPR